MERLTHVFDMIGYYVIAAAFFVANGAIYSVVVLSLVDWLGMRPVYRATNLSETKQFRIANAILVTGIFIIILLLVFYCTGTFAILPLPAKPV